MADQVNPKDGTLSIPYFDDINKPVKKKKQHYHPTKDFKKKQKKKQKKVKKSLKRYYDRSGDGNDEEGSQGKKPRHEKAY